MARFQNGLRLSKSAGHQFSRWMCEFATQVLGWTIHDINSVAGWTSTQSAAADAATHASNAAILDFSGAAYTLTSADTGRIVTMLGNAGWSAAEKERIGMYEIIWVDASAEHAYLDIKRGVHENGLPLNKTNVSYRIWDTLSGDLPGNGSYAVIKTPYLNTPVIPDMHVYLSAGGHDGIVPGLAIGPFEGWDSAAHAWKDSRNTGSAIRPDAGSKWSMQVWAFGDETNNDHFTVLVRDVATGNLWLYYVGAITPTAGTTIDTNPGIVWTGWSLRTYPWGYNNQSNIDEQARWMAYNSGGNDVAVAGYMMGPSIILDQNVNLFDGNRLWSQWSRGVYRIEPMLQCRTAGHMETRGTPKNLWIGGHYQGLTPFGTSLEYLHVQSGYMIPWNGSKVHVQWDNA